MDAQTKRQLLALNFGEKYRDCVKLVPAEITRDDKAFIKELYTSLLNNSDVGHVVASGVDTEQLQQLLAIPKNEKQEAVMNKIQDEVQGAGDGARSEGLGEQTGSQYPYAAEERPEYNSQTSESDEYGNY